MKKFLLLMLACFMALCFAVPAMATGLPDGDGLVFCDQTDTDTVAAVVFNVVTKIQPINEWPPLNQIIYTPLLAVVDSAESEDAALAYSLSVGLSGQLITLHSIYTDGSNLHEFIKG